MSVDYTTEADPFDIEIAAHFTSEKSAEQIELENSFRDVPIGDHLLRILRVEGMKHDEPIKVEMFDVFVDGKPTSYDAHKLKVRFCMVDDPGAQITDVMVLPPANPKHLDAYLRGSKKVEGGKGCGWWANKFVHFVQRIGWPFGPGERIPAEACRTANWKGKVVMATVEPGDPYEDKTTRETKEGRNQIKNFSYRAVGDHASTSATQPASRPAAESKPAPKPRQQATRPTAATNGLGSL